MPRAFLLFALPTALLACGPSPKQLALRAAESASAQGEHLQAAAHLRRACELDPKDKEVCARAEQTQRFAIDHGLKEAEKDLDAGKLFEGLEHLAEVTPHDKERKGDALRGRFRTALLEFCDSSLSDSGESAVAWIDYVRCFSRGQTTLRSDEYDAQLRERRGRAAKGLTGLADRASAAQRLGQADGLRTLAQCTEPTSERERAARDQHSSYFDSISIPFELHFAQTFSGEVLDTVGQCQVLQQRWPILTCLANPVHGRTLVAKYVLSTEPQRHEQQVSQHEVEYVVRVEQVVNPEREPARRAEAEAQRRVDAAQSAHDAAEQRCQTARNARVAANNCFSCAEYRAEQQACDAASNASSRLRDAERTWRDASATLQRTPAQVDREVRDIYRYREVRHLDTQKYQLDATLESRVPPRRQPQQTSGQIEFVSIERPGFAKAGVESSSRKKPTSSEFNLALLGRAGDFIVQTVEQELTQRADSQSGADPLRDDQVERWLHEQALRGTDPAAAYAKWLGDHSPGRHPAVGCIKP